MSRPADDRLALERASEILGHLDIGVLALDQTGRVAFYNSRAKSMFSDDMRVVRSTVTFTDPTHSSLYTEHVNALRAAGGRSEAAVASMVIARSDAPPLLIKFVPNIGPAATSIESLSGFVVLRPVEAYNNVSESRVRAAFNLTASEARLAARLSSGATLAEVADDLHISINTARAHLRTIFQKTNTKRQSQLIALLSSLA